MWRVVPPESIERMRRPERIEIGLPQIAARHAGASAKLALQRAVVVQDKLAFVFNRHALIIPMAHQTLDDLPTPALILDRAILRRNLKRMSDRLREGRRDASTASQDREIGPGRPHGGRGP
jgi:hypothetical protein